MLSQYFYTIIDPLYSDSLKGESNDRFDLTLDLTRPEIVTMGWIPGLEKLAPFTLKTRFDNTQQSWALNAALPFIQYQNISLEDVEVQSDFQKEKLNYQLAWQDADFSNSLQIENFQSFGQIENQTLQNTTHILDQEGVQRFAIHSKLDFLQDQNFRLSLLPEQLLNYQSWKASEANQITFGAQNIEVSNWRFLTVSYK